MAMTERDYRERATLRPGQRYERKRGFRRATRRKHIDEARAYLATCDRWEKGFIEAEIAGLEAEERELEQAPRWWVTGVTRTGSAPAHGLEVIEIVETVDTATVGRLVLYRQWVLDPDGNEVGSLWVKCRRKTLLFRGETKLRSSLRQMGFERAGADLRVVA
jgi:hypothetical protein